MQQDHLAVADAARLPQRATNVPGVTGDAPATSAAAAEAAVEAARWPCPCGEHGSTTKGCEWSNRCGRQQSSTYSEPVPETASPSAGPAEPEDDLALAVVVGRVVDASLVEADRLEPLGADFNGTKPPAAAAKHDVLGIVIFGDRLGVVLLGSGIGITLAHRVQCAMSFRCDSSRKPCQNGRQIR